MITDEEAFYTLRRSDRFKKPDLKPANALTEEERQQLAQALQASKEAADNEAPWPGEDA